MQGTTQHCCIILNIHTSSSSHLKKKKKKKKTTLYAYGRYLRHRGMVNFDPRVTTEDHSTLLLTKCKKLWTLWFRETANLFFICDFIYLSVFNLVISHLSFWSDNFFLIAQFPDRCLLLHFSSNVTKDSI